MSHHKLVEKRISYLVAISLVILLAFAVRLVDIQGVRAAGLANKAENELTKESVIMAPRGAITDIN
ncbi:MAG: penicillin-binding protein 2, partial [Actinobacteria bacterium]|nr:penicillin-binding protein 2 [Actinomycetota bacterium]NDA36534.1 penicillin-binding protein 2 [Actinomycetota bacterium]